MTQIASAGQLRASVARWMVVLVPVVNLLGFLSARLSMSGEGNPWFAALVKPALYPPPIAFPLVWTGLYVLMGMAMAMVAAARGAPGRGVAAGAFGLHLVTNLVWSPLFFGAHWISGALWDAAAMAISLALCMALFARVRPLAAWLLVPYLCWVLFACVLTWQVLQANPGADAAGFGGLSFKL